MCARLCARDEDTYLSGQRVRADLQRRQLEAQPAHRTGSRIHGHRWAALAPDADFYLSLIESLLEGRHSLPYMHSAQRCADVALEDGVALHATTYIILIRGG